MSANLLHQLRQSGIRLQPRGDRLHVEAAPGAVTPELRLILTEHKADLLAALSGDVLRTRLLALADSEVIDADHVHRLTTTDLAECDGLPDAVLLAYVRALADADLRKRGKVPPDETAAALCRCGPVWVAPEVASAAPVAAGWPRVLGCPWCHAKNRQGIPRPTVACGECRHFIRSAVNPSAGMGRCSAQRVPLRNEPLPYPHAARCCAEWRPSRAS
jgi:hypothetical protein